MFQKYVQDFGDAKGNMPKLIRNTGPLSTLIKHEFSHVKIVVLI